MTSQGARGGFENEDSVCRSFRNMDEDAIIWLRHMGIDPNKVSRIECRKGPAGFKPDLVVKAFSAGNVLVAEERISVKLSSGLHGFNQIDRGDVERRYAKLWNTLSNDAQTGLRLFTGALAPLRPGRDKSNKRMYLDELPPQYRSEILSFFTQNKRAVISDLLAGRDPNKAMWLLTVVKVSGRSKIMRMSDAIDFYSIGPVTISNRGSLIIGKVTAQRKGGDSGGEGAKNLQFKFDPTEIM